MKQGFEKLKEKNNDKNCHSKFYLFLKEVSRASYKNIHKPKLVYRLLIENIDILNNDLLDWLSIKLLNILCTLNKLKAFSLVRDICCFNEIITNFPLGNKAINLEIAIIAWEICAEFMNQQKGDYKKIIFAEIKCNLGLVYSERIYGNKSKNIEKAITACSEALRIIKREEMPAMWATIQNNLARAYSYSNDANKAENLELAISLFKSALPIHTRKLFPKDWAKLQHNLGEAYLQRIKGDKAENLDKSLMYLSSALEVYTKEGFPELWANSLNTMGAVLVERIRGDRAENLEIAIACFKAALQVRISEIWPYDWAQTNLNLANAYRERIRGNPIENLFIAIATYEVVLQVYTQEKFPREWAMTQNNLGLAYINIKNQEKAITAFTAACQVHTKEIFPIDWAMTQKNLGITYTQRIIGNKAENLDQAIKAYEAASQVFSRDNFPYYWAKNQHNLAATYTSLGDINQAITCCRLSLEVFTATTFPIECFASGRQFGNFSLKAKCWLEAIEGYTVAIEALETSRSWVSSESRRQEILEGAIDVYQNIVQACINAGEIEKAFEYAERSRAKRLVDLMASNDFFQGDAIPPAVESLLQQYEELQRQIDIERDRHKSGNNRSETRAAFQAYNEAIAALENQKQQIWEEIRRLDPVLAGEIQVSAPEFSAIQKLIDKPNTALLSFYTTDTDTYIFVLQQNQITLHTCTGQGLDNLQNWISQNWLFAYLNREGETKQEKAKRQETWYGSMSSILTEMAERLQINTLINQHLQGIEELILIPHLLLHQIPFVALHLNNNQYLGDKFLIRYIPSCQILDFCWQRKHLKNIPEQSLKYGTVEDAEDNLPFARIECEKIAQLYNIPQEQRLIGKTQATRKNYRQLAQTVNVLHSSHHAQSRLDNPLESELKLAGESITLGQLMSPSWRLPNLVDVFLSCCETHLGKPSLTDDIFTLSTGFLCAGAINVVSTLWAVSDLATALLSIFYYQYRQQNKSCSEALQQSQFKLRNFKKHELKGIFSGAETREKELISMKKKYILGSVEYQECKSEQKRYEKINLLINIIEKSTEEFPFSHPRYWAAFICQGLR